MHTNADKKKWKTLDAVKREQSIIRDLAASCQLVSHSPKPPKITCVSQKDFLGCGI